MKRQISLIFSFLILVLPASTNYKLNDYGFGSGGVGNAVSNNYGIFGISGQTGSDLLTSGSYKIGSGVIPTQAANVPGAPTLSNPSSYYNKLNIVINTSENPTDTRYAVAISDDDFVTTSYVKSDYFLGTTLVYGDYLTYAQWGNGSGTTIYGLKSSTTYKVKARAITGKYSESDWGPISTGVATLSTAISFSIGGVASGTMIANAITDVTSSAVGISFGELSIDNPVEAAQSLVATTNANSGYTILVNQVSDLKNELDVLFPTITGTNAAPIAWPANIGAYGYHTTDALLGTGSTTRFSPDNTFAPFTTTPLEVAYSATPVTNETTYILYSIQAGHAPPGNYSQTLTYTIYGIF